MASCWREKDELTNVKYTYIYIYSDYAMKYKYDVDNILYNVKIYRQGSYNDETTITKMYDSQAA